ncbi:hypothetical protein QFZ87_000617 [Bacillus sp. SLBN-46]|nr:hypothetical protein [Bacillus sp. SLBN-46]
MASLGGCEEMEFKDMFESKYRNILYSYLKESTEAALYQGQKFSRKAMEHQISPEEIINCALYRIEGAFPRPPARSVRFLRLSIRGDDGLWVSLPGTSKPPRPAA